MFIISRIVFLGSTTVAHTVAHKCKTIYFYLKQNTFIENKKLMFWIKNKTFFFKTNYFLQNRSCFFVISNLLFGLGLEDRILFRNKVVSFEKRILFLYFRNRILSFETIFFLSKQNSFFRNKILSFETKLTFQKRPIRGLGRV